LPSIRAASNGSEIFVLERPCSLPTAPAMQECRANVEDELVGLVLGSILPEGSLISLPDCRLVMGAVTKTLRNNANHIDRSISRIDLFRGQLASVTTGNVEDVIVENARCAGNAVSRGLAVLLC
jgi:hypothetical protein